MNWGLRITTLYLGFVSIIVTLVVICFNHKTELEFKDYYSRELNFQEQINASENAVQLETPIDYSVNGKTVEISFPKQLLSAGLKGEILFLRPSDGSKDKIISITPGTDGKQIINDPSFVKGVYKMQISVSAEGKKYFKEAVITLK